MRSLLYRALSGLASGVSGVVAHDGTGKLQVAAPLDALLPAGVIVMWSGTLGTVPSGWALCDGDNGTPDLRNRFVKGWSQGINPGTTGGSVTHTHAYTDVPNHTHPVSVTDPGHAHIQGVNSATTGGLSGYTPDTSTNTRVNSGYATSSATTGITAATSNPAGGVAQGTTQAAASEPPYFQLAFIMKL